VERATPLLIILTSAEVPRGYWTIFLVGYDPATGIGGPPALARGRGVQRDGEIVLDAVFARKFGYTTDDRIVVNGKPLVVVGLSTGTNAIVVQYTFVTMSCAQSMLPFPGLVSAVVVKVAAGASTTDVRTRLDALRPTSHCFTRSEFLANNLAEMSNGFLPVLSLVTGVSAVVLTAILGLLTGMTILRRRRDYAILKMIGSPSRFLWTQLARRVAVQVGSGAAAGIALFYLVRPVVKALMPEIECVLAAWQHLAAVGTACAAGTVSVVAAGLRLRTIYPLEILSWKQ
jgi:putative ABC transport system permease protein